MMREFGSLVVSMAVLALAWSLKTMLICTLIQDISLLLRKNLRKGGNSRSKALISITGNRLSKTYIRVRMSDTIQPLFLLYNGESEVLSSKTMNSILSTLTKILLI